MANRNLDACFAPAFVYLAFVYLAFVYLAFVYLERLIRSQAFGRAWLRRVVCVTLSLRVHDGAPP